jgi:hypothetical protein
LHTAVPDEENFDDPDSFNPVLKSSNEGREKLFELVRLLLNAGTDINSRDEHDGSFPLHKAARLGIRARDVVACYYKKEVMSTDMMRMGRRYFFMQCKEMI